jgi:hypothetical protein
MTNTMGGLSGPIRRAEWFYTKVEGILVAKQSHSEHVRRHVKSQLDRAKTPELHQTIATMT